MRLLGKALTFDDVLLVPAYLPGVAPRHQPGDPAVPQHRAEPAAGVRRDGHRDRGAAGDRHRAGRRHRHRAQEPDAAGSRRPRWRASSATSPACCATRSPSRPRRTVRAGDGAVAAARHLGLPGARRQDGGGHRHQPRPAFRDAHGRAGARDHDAARAPGHGERRRHHRRRQGADAPAQARARAGRQRRLRAARADDGEGHHQADQLSRTPRATRHGKLRVGAAVGVGEGTEERVELLVRPASMRSWSTPRTATAPA